MNESYIVEKKFDANALSKNPLSIGVYDECQFNNCDFQKQDLSKFSFIDCVFNHCNLSNALVANTVFRDVLFNDCKILGVAFNDVLKNNLVVKFQNCTLDYCSFHQLKIPNFQLKDCSLVAVDFTECDLKQTNFNNCNLQDAIFENTILIATDFSTAYNYAIDPNKNQIKNAKFGLSGLPGLLHLYKIQIDTSK
ncbi:MAG: pentapeptide repeat-containing protein [Chitinophagaceae bacterium]|nr:MAG: pentapeptide repeat-containing protein [Chitinophagaceae bacterium]